MNLSDDFILELTQCQQRLYGYIFRRMANRDQAMEVLQQTNLVLCRKADDFELGTNFDAWACTVAHYQILAYRKSMVRERLVFTDDVFHVIDDREDDADHRTEHMRLLRHCYGELSKANQTFMNLRYKDGLSVRQMAAEVGKQAGAVRVQLHRLRFNLKECVRRKLKEQEV